MAPMEYSTDKDIVREQPVLATVLVVVVSFVGYVGLTLVLDGAVRPVESALFAGAFTVVYMAFALMSQRLGE